MIIFAAIFIFGGLLLRGYSNEADMDKIKKENQELKTSLSQISNRYGTAQSFNVNELGVAGDGNVRNAEANTANINKALINYMEVFIPDGTYYVSSSIVVPDNKRLIMAKGCVIKPVESFDVITFGNNVYIESGQVDVRDLGDKFTHSCLINAQGRFSNVIVRRFIALHNYASRSGYGITLRGTNTSAQSIVCFSRFEDFFLQYFQRGINIEVLNPNYMNSNYFSGTSSVCSNAVYNDGGNGNYFHIEAQCGTDNTVPCVYLKGDDNTLAGMLYDVGLHADWNQIAAEIKGTGNFIAYTPMYANQLIDHNEGQNDTMKTRKIRVPARGAPCVPSGAQDNFLLAADARFTVTEAYTNVSLTDPSNYPLKNAFRSYGQYGVDYTFANPDSPTDNVEISLDLLGEYAFNMIGFTTPANLGTKRVVISVYSAYDGTWYSKELMPANGGSFSWELSGPYGISYDKYTRISKIRYTLYQPYASNGRMQVTNFFASNIFGSVGFIPADGGTVYGDISFGAAGTGPIIRSPNGTQYRITVTDAGVITATEL